MKNFFQKIRGKKNDQEGNRRRSADERARFGVAAAPQNQPFITSLPATQNRNVGGEQLAGPSGSSTLPQTLNATYLSQGQVSALLESLASSSASANPSYLVQAQPTKICQTCYNFDPHRAPRDGNTGELMQSWATAEYNIPAETPVARLTLKEPKRMLDESTKAGCFYCFMIQVALDKAHPTWETERWYVDLCLAPHIPVIVRLRPGKLATEPYTLEDAHGIEVRPGGQRLVLEITMFKDVPLADIPPEVDVEIYRTHLRPDQITAHDRILGPFQDHIAIAEEIPKDADDQRCFDFIEKEVANCKENHDCGGDEKLFPLPIVPDRIIWVEAPNTSRIQLREPINRLRSRYIALSYSWGSGRSNTYLTNKSNIDAMKAGIEYSDLPPLFQDVVRCARTLRIQYIWIDRLCIIQDDAKDWERQAAKMGEVYGNATLTIAAASTSSANDRILVERDPKWRPGNLTIDIGALGSLKVCYRRRTHLLGTEDKGGDYGRISNRGWVWQERLLSKRTIFYTPSALKFECHHHSVWEGSGPGAAVGRSWSTQLDNVTPESWLGLVEEYTSRDMTYPKDRLIAMESVMKRIEKSKGWSRFFGVWSNALVVHLGWKPKNMVEGAGTHACRMNPKRFAPTWSWAGVEGPISYDSIKTFFKQDPMAYDLDLLEFDATPKFDATLELDATSGWIKVLGYATMVTLSCRVERDGDELKEGGGGEEKFRYRYEIKNAYKPDQGDPFPVTAQPVTADAVLKPWGSKIKEDGTMTVIRVPHGQKPPTQSWSGECLCLLLGRRASGTGLVLFLGESLKERGARERIGMAVAGHESTIFPECRRQVIKIL